MTSPSDSMAYATRTASSVLSLCALVGASVLACLAWLSPNHYLPWPSFHSELPMACAGLLLAVWALSQRREQALRAPWLFVLAVATSALPWAQWLAGTVFFVGEAWVSSLYLVALALGVLVGHRIVVLYGPTRAFEGLAGVVLLGAVVSTWIALNQWLELKHFQWTALGLEPGSRYYANFAQPNHFALLLVLGIVCTGLLYVRGRIGAVGGGLLLVLLSLGIAMSASRAAYLELGAVSAWLFFARTRLPAGQRDRLSPATLLIASLLVIAAALTWPALRDAWNPPPPEGAGVDHSLLRAGDTRRSHWLVLLDAATRRPWSGYGWYQTNSAQLEAAASHPATYQTLAQSHNQFLDLIVWVGLPLGLLLGGALIVWFAQVMRKVRGAEGVLAVAFVGAAFAHSLVEFPLYYAYFLIPVALAMGGLSATITSNATIRLQRHLVYVLVAATAILTSLVSLEYFRIEEYWRALRFEHANIGAKRVSNNQPDIYINTGLREFLRLGSQPPVLPVSDEETLQIGKLAMRYPHAFYLTLYAAALADRGHGTQASAVLASVCKVHGAGLCRASKEQWSQYAATRPNVSRLAWPDSD